MKRWRWVLAAGGALVVLGIVGAALLGILGSGSPTGREIARHTYEGKAYVLVEYGDKLAIFSGSGAPVSQRGLAEGILRSYAWRQVIGSLDFERLAAVSEEVGRLDDSVADVRNLSNNVVAIFDDLADMNASVPFVGSISAMDVVRKAFPGVGDAEDVIRSLETELNELGESATLLARASKRIPGEDLSSVSVDEMDALFADASGAARDLRNSVRTAKDLVLVAGGQVESLENALRAGSDTPIIGDTLGDFAGSAGRFESELASLSNMMGSFELELKRLEEDLREALDSADRTFAGDMKRWLAEPLDAEWPPADLERRPSASRSR